MALDAEVIKGWVAAADALIEPVLDLLEMAGERIGNGVKDLRDYQVWLELRAWGADRTADLRMLQDELDDTLRSYRKMLEQ